MNSSVTPNTRAQSKAPSKALSKAKIVVDARAVGPTPHGFGRYISMMARGLAELGGERPYELIFLVRADFPFGQNTWGEQTRGRPSIWGFETIPVKTAFLSPRELFDLPRIIRDAKADLYHSPTFSSLRKLGCPWISTVHDLNHLYFGGNSKKLYYRILLKPFARQARRLLTVSEFSRGELARWLNRPVDDIEVVYNALDPGLVNPPSDAEIQRVLTELGLQRGKYFYTLSNPKPHKNGATLVRAYSRYRAQAPETAWPLVLNFKPSGKSSGVIALGAISEEDARALLAGAGALFFPSRYEGFGLPPVEAAASGVPVVASEIAPHREALLDLGPRNVAWVDPEDLGGWEESFRKIQSGQLTGPDAQLRQALINRFSVARLGQHMDRIYRDVLGLRV